MNEAPKPVAFADARKDQFPINIYGFSPIGELVFHREIQPYVMVDIPGSGPGSVRYVVMTYADGTATLYDNESDSEPPFPELWEAE